MKTLKYSRQRGSVKASLMNRHDHPTADTPYVSIHEEFPNISLGTVYRNLNLLVETGEMKKLTCGGDADHFDGDIQQHYHFVYAEYNQVYDVGLGALEELNQEAQESAPGIVDSHYVLFYGRYKKCLGRKINKGVDRPAQMIYINISNNYYYRLKQK